jgi:glycosyltransferase involved in cell wall biosynthesis
MKIAFLTPEYPHPKTGTSGGLGTSIHHLAKALVQMGHEIHLLIYAQPKDAIWEENGLVFHQIKNIKFKGLSWYLTRKKIEKYIDILYQKKQIHIVEAPDWTGITSFIKPKKCPIVIRLNGSDTYFCHLENRKVKWFNQFHEKKALQQAKGHISVSQYTATVTNQVFGGNFPFEIIPNGIEMNQFLELPKERYLEGSILYLGTLIRKKGVLEIPEIFNRVVAKYPKATLHLVGADTSDIATKSPSTWQLMQKLFTKQAVKQVTYHGKVPYSRVKEFLEQANLVIFPSYAEALPLAWLEAMAMQKAIVASDIGWAEEVITDGKEGFLVHPTKHQEFSDKMLQLLENKDLASQFGIHAKQKIAQNFSNFQVAKQTINYYAKVLQTT